MVPIEHRTLVPEDNAVHALWDRQKHKIAPRNVA
jgi:hypothetical protein